MCPIGNLNLAGAAILAELDHRDAAARIFAKIDKHFVGHERPRNHFVHRFGVVGKPERTGGAGSCLLADLLGKDRGVKSALGEKNAASQTGHTSTNNGDATGNGRCAHDGIFICRHRQSAARKTMLALSEIHFPMAKAADEYSTRSR